MTLADLIKVVAKELGTSDLNEINKILKAEVDVKFRITGKALGHFGFTGKIKSISEEGVKAFMANKVSLIRMKDIDTFEKAKPREERPVRTGPKPAPKTVAPVKPKPAAKSAKKIKNDDAFDDEDFDDEDDFDSADVRPSKSKKAKSTGKSGSRFIPASKK